MRVISQDGTMDFPYEISTIFIYPSIENVIAIQSAGDSEFSIIGRYSSKANAIKAMEMLREQYGKLEVMKVLASGTAEYMEKALATDEMIKHYNTYCDMNVFQFPQDEDVEINNGLE